MRVADPYVLAELQLLVLYPLLAVCLAMVLVLNVYNVVPLIWLRFRPSTSEGEAVPSTGDKITLLLPAYREERTLARCVRSIAALDYPPEKLEVIIVTEADDVSTTRLAQGLADGRLGGFSITVVVARDNGAPAGKPRALNQGLEVAAGDVIGVIDAEDIVAPDLCTRVVHELSVRGLDAVQGVLDMANDYDGWMNLQFRAEYGYWFNLYIPGAAKAGYPVPFGGTTNFLTRSALTRLGGWDAHNLTEDFDVGIRAYLAGMKVGAIPCVTREESPTSFAAWLRQRTRWQRGKIQTFAKVLRGRPGGIGKGVHAFLTCLVPHTPVFNLGTLLSSVYVMQFGGALPRGYSYFASAMSVWIVWFCVLNGYGYLLATKAETVPRRRLRALVCAVTLPVYWLAQWLAELRAIKQELLERTVFWEKTEHHLRHECADGIYRRIELRKQLVRAGYSLRERCSLRGRSGSPYTVDIYGTRGSSSVIVQSIASEQVAADEMMNVARMAADVRADRLVLLVPRLTTEAKALAEQLGIDVLEWESSDHELSSFAPRLLPVEAGT